MGAQWRRGIRDPAYEIEPRWTVCEEFSKQRFDKLANIVPVDNGIERSAGQLFAFNHSWERASFQKPLRLPIFNGQVFNEPIVTDPIIQELAQQKKANIFATDVAAAAMMCSTKATWSWDLVIKKFMNILFIDKREEENMLDFNTVAESAGEYQPNDDDTMNGARQLMREAQKCQNSFIYNCTNKKETKKMQEDDPFIESDDQVAARIGYEYRLWKLDKNNTICIRCTVHAYDRVTNEKVNAYVLPEYAPKHQNWIKQLDNQTANCFTREIADNASKMSRWTVQSLLAEVDQMRFAFVKRADPLGKSH